MNLAISDVDHVLVGIEDTLEVSSLCLVVTEESEVVVHSVVEVMDLCEVAVGTVEMNSHVVGVVVSVVNMVSVSS